MSKNGSQKENQNEIILNLKKAYDSRTGYFDSVLFEKNVKYISKLRKEMLK